jgi:superfamily I DNA/RNA helicase
VHTAADEAAEAAFVVGTIERVLGGSDLTALLRGAADPWTDAVHSYADFAVLYRTDAQSAALVDALEAAGVPYQKRSHHRLGDQPGVRELLGVLREDLVRAAATRGRCSPGSAPPARSPSTVPAGLRLHSPTPRRCRPTGMGRRGGIGVDRWSQLTPATARAAAAGRPDADPARRVAELQAAVELLGPLAERAGADAERFLAELALGAEVDLGTRGPTGSACSPCTRRRVSSSRAVFVVGCEDGLLPMRFGDEPGDPAEERRLLFVGMTRARTHLALSGARRRTVRGRVSSPRPRRTWPTCRRSLVERTSRPERRRTVQLRLL